MAGCASAGVPLPISRAIDRRSASARPMIGLAFSSAKVPVVSLHRRIRVDIPVRHQQGPRLGVEEGARQTGEGLGIALVAGSGVAGRQHHPVGIELELRHLGSREQAVVLFELGCRGRAVGRGQDQGRFGLGLAGWPRSRRPAGHGWQNAAPGSARACRSCDSALRLRSVARSPSQTVLTSALSAPSASATAHSSSAVSGSGSCRRSSVRSMARRPIPRLSQVPGIGYPRCPAGGLQACLPQARLSVPLAPNSSGLPKAM